MNTDGKDVGKEADGASGRHGDKKSTHVGLKSELQRSVADRWILSRLQRTKRTVCDAIESYRFDHAAQAVYEFTWNEYCDWYLELSKTVLNDNTASAAAKRGTRRTLVRVLESLLRLAHPIMPFITEEIWQRVAPLAGKSGSTIMVQPFPSHRAPLVDDEAEREMQWIMQFILGIRKIKGEMNIAPGRPVPVLLAGTSDKDRNWAVEHRKFLDFLARTESIEILPAGTRGPESATALVGKMQVLIPLAGLIDKAAESARLRKEVGKLQGELERTEKKLQNPSFVDKAPPPVVQKEKDKLTDTRSALAELEAQLRRIEAL
jgi:valyl-tRNA synthetase